MLWIPTLNCFFADSKNDRRETASLSHVFHTHMLSYHSWWASKSKELCWEWSDSKDILIVTPETLQVERPDPEILQVERPDPSRWDLCQSKHTIININVEFDIIFCSAFQHWSYFDISIIMSVSGLCPLSSLSQRWEKLQGKSFQFSDWEIPSRSEATVLTAGNILWPWNMERVPPEREPQ